MAEEADESDAYDRCGFDMCAGRNTVSYLSSWYRIQVPRRVCLHQGFLDIAPGKTPFSGCWNVGNGDIKTNQTAH